MCENESINEELNALLNMKKHVELEITCVKELKEFKESFKFKKALSPFIDNFIDKYSKRNLFYNRDIKILCDLLNEIEHQIRSSCKHRYCDDEIEGSFENGFTKITYCEICYLTF